MTADIDQYIELAVSKLKAGLLVAFPTETVYGLGADASSAAALERLYAVKGRPTSHPVIVHIASVEQLTDWAKDIPAQAYQLAERFWPGPMTLILPLYNLSASDRVIFSLEVTVLVSTFLSLRIRSDSARLTNGLSLETKANRQRRSPTSYGGRGSNNSPKSIEKSTKYTAYKHFRVAARLAATM